MISPNRQRWRIAFRRRPATPETTQPAFATTFAEALAASGLPFPEGRPRLAFAMPMLAGIAVERDLVDVELTERLPVGTVRAAIAMALPEGAELVDLHDVWLGEPPLPAQARRAEYEVIVRVVGSPGSLPAAAASVLSSERLPREREKGGRSVAYDLRPLIVDVVVEDVASAGETRPAVLRIVVALDPVRGVGRPEEVVAALGEAMGSEAQITTEHTTRRRIVLEADLRERAGPTASD